MARVTLLDKWNSLMAEIEVIKEKQISDFFETNFKPDTLYVLRGRSGDIKEYPVDGFTVKHDGFRAPSLYGKKPTGAYVEALLSYKKAIQESTPIIVVLYKTDYGASGGQDYDKINGFWAFSQSDLEETAKEHKEKYAPREGYAPCRYCGKQTPEDNLITSTIIGRGRKDVWNSWKNRYESKACVTKEQLRFCSNQCAANEQMSREG